MDGRDQEVSRVALITGGSRGIGRAFVLEAARRGYRPVFSYRARKSDAEDTVSSAKALGCEAVAVQADLADFDPVDMTATDEADFDRQFLDSWRRELLERAWEELDRLARYKALHDCLHTLQLQLSAITRAARAFPSELTAGREFHPLERVG